MTEISRETLFVGVSGFQGAGKTTVSNILSQQTGMPVFHVADPIKDLVYDLNPLDADGMSLLTHFDIHGEAASKRTHSEYRRYLQVIGEHVRDMDESFWFDWLRFRARGYQGVIVGDVRFPYEVEQCPMLVNVVRPGVESTGHVSDADMSGYATHTIINDGSLDDLATKVATMLASIDFPSPQQF